MASISICIPAYNCGEAVIECVDSIMRQSHCSWEVIIVDDGSDIETEYLLDEIALRDSSKIRVIHTSNRGPYAARRTAFELAENDYIMCLDSDDEIIGSDALAKLSEIADGYSPDLIMFNGTTNLQTRSLFTDYSGIANEKNAQVSCDAFRSELLRSYNLNNLAFKMIKATILKESEEFCGHLTMAEDRYQVLQIADKIKSIYLINEPLYFYRPNSESTTHSIYRYEYYEQICFVEQFALEKVKQWGCSLSDWAQLFQSISYGAIRSVRKTTKRYKTRLDFYRRVLESTAYQYSREVLGSARGRLDRKIANVLLQKKAFYILDAYLLIMVIIVAMIERRGEEMP